jgi:hypothetical protein
MKFFKSQLVHNECGEVQDSSPPRAPSPMCHSLNELKESQQGNLSGPDEKSEKPRQPSDSTTASCLVPTPTLMEKTTTYPEGGREAWLVVFGAFCGLTASLGIYNTSGVFSAVLSHVILPGESPSKLGWLFSIYAFVTWICGVQIGPTFDVMGPRYLIIAGTVCTIIGIFTMSVSTGMYHVDRLHH